MSDPANNFPPRRDVPAAKRSEHETRMQHVAEAVRHHHAALSDRALDAYTRDEHKQAFSRAMALVMDGVLKGWPIPPEEAEMVPAPLTSQLGQLLICSLIKGEPVTQAAAAEELGVTAAAVSKIVKAEDWGGFFKRGKRGPKRSKTKVDFFSLVERFGSR